MQAKHNLGNDSKSGPSHAITKNTIEQLNKQFN